MSLHSLNLQDTCPNVRNESAYGENIAQSRWTGKKNRGPRQCAIVLVTLGKDIKRQVPPEYWGKLGVA